METLINESNLDQAHEEGREGNGNFNCYCTSLFILGQVKELYWVDCPEITEFIHKHTIEVSNAQRGDMLVMWEEDMCDEYGDEQDEDGCIISHTAVYLGNGRWFHKEGGSKSSFGTQQDVLDAYLHAFWEYRRVEK
jgi:hypothetical protein